MKFPKIDGQKASRNAMRLSPGCSLERAWAFWFQSNNLLLGGLAAAPVISGRHSRC
jgi:hypothetical protein